MNSQKFKIQIITAIIAVVFSMLSVFLVFLVTRNRNVPLTSSTKQAASSTSAQQANLFKLIKTVQVTPTSTFKSGSFVRIGYVPGKKRIIVTFSTALSQPQAGCNDIGYAYKEYTTDMVETGNAGVISCHALVDTGGLFVGDDFYLASQELQNGKEGWYLAKYNTNTWATSTNSFFYTLRTIVGGDDVMEDPADPTLALVNGQIDISSTYRSEIKTSWGPFASAATHHNFFTTDLQFVSKRVLSDTPHINLSSMITANGTTNFLTNTALIGDIIVMQYDSNWKYLGVKTLKKKSATPEGVAFDGKRFYVAYQDQPCTNVPCDEETPQNVRLAAFDLNWNLLDDIAVTSLTSQDSSNTARPTLVLQNGRLYVGYDQHDPTIVDAISPGFRTQVNVKVYDVSDE